MQKMFGHLAQNDHAKNIIMGDIFCFDTADQFAVFHHMKAIREIKYIMKVVTYQ